MRDKRALRKSADNAAYASLPVKGYIGIEGTDAEQEMNCGKDKCKNTANRQLCFPESTDSLPDRPFACRLFPDTLLFFSSPGRKKPPRPAVRQTTERNFVYSSVSEIRKKQRIIVDFSGKN